MDQSAAFNLLHEGVRRQLWKMMWGELRLLQVQAIKHILTTDQHAILSAGTASGKTEAAFLPILSAIADNPTGSVRALYVGPLKALINDQFERVEELCSHLDIPVYRWHGDIGASAKKKLVESPAGVLLITPESIESLFVNRSHALFKLFGGLRFVVIDELHAFLDTERGLHLRSLLSRVSALTSDPMRIVGLSATIGNPDIAIKYVDRDHPDRVKVIVGDSAEAELKLRVHAYADVEALDEDSSSDNEVRPTAQERRIATDLVKHCRGSANLVFANNRNDVELFADLCKDIAARESLPDQFLVHHGSLSAEIREDTEETMKDSSGAGKAATTFCSSTLEMGIDIGSVSTVGQIGSPYAVASLKQRVGRSGRRGSPRVLRMYLRCKSVDEKSDLFERMHLGLVQAIAVVELMLLKWVEPPEPNEFDLSTLTQQVISVIAETGGCPAEQLYKVLCARGAFRSIDARTFAMLLRDLGAADVIEQVPQGDLILGLVGEQLRKDKGFYAVFPSSDSYAVLNDGRKIGSVDSAPRPTEHMILAGRRWKVTDVDERQRVIYVIAARGSKLSRFVGEGPPLHPEIVKMMRKILGSTDEFTYLNQTASLLLADARETAARSSACTAPFVQLGPRRTAIMTWMGGRAKGTMWAMLKTTGMSVGSGVVALIANDAIEATRHSLAKLSASPPTLDQLADVFAGTAPGKYGAFVGPDLASEGVKRLSLDIDTPLDWIRANVAS